MVDVPVDIFTSSSELLILFPVGGVAKDSLRISLEEKVLVMRGERKRPLLKETYVPLKEECYRGLFEKRIELPDHVYFDKISSELTPENILRIIVPKVLKPDEIPIKVL